MNRHLKILIALALVVCVACCGEGRATDPSVSLRESLVPTAIKSVDLGTVSIAGEAKGDKVKVRVTTSTTRISILLGLPTSNGSRNTRRFTISTTATAIGRIRLTIVSRGVFGRLFGTRGSTRAMTTLVTATLPITTQ